MPEIGSISGYKVYWDPSSGRVDVGMEHAGQASSQAEAMEVAKRWIERYGRR
jgi:hypothetical protein